MIFLKQITTFLSPLKLLDGNAHKISTGGGMWISLSLEGVFGVRIIQG